MMNIRSATTADVDSIATLLVDVQNIHATALPHIFKSVTDGEFAKAQLEAQIADLNTHGFIISLNGNVVGYVLARVVRRPESVYMHAREFIYVDQIAVKPAHQGKGYGTALIRAVCDLAGELDINTVSLDFWDFNETAGGFYSRLGFTTYNYRVWKQL